MNYKKYLRWGIFHIIFVIFLTIANYKVFGFEFTIMYLMLEIVPYIDCNKDKYIDDIKSIVTKEQFSQMEYRIGE